MRVASRSFSLTGIMAEVSEMSVATVRPNARQNRDSLLEYSPRASQQEGDNRLCQMRNHCIVLMFALESSRLSVLSFCSALISRTAGYGPVRPACAVVARRAKSYMVWEGSPREGATCPDITCHIVTCSYFSSNLLIPL